MAKKTPHDDDEMELTMIKEHLNQQDKTMGEILILLKGSVSMDVKGIMAEYKELRVQVNQITSDLAHYERWRQKQIQSKGEITFTVSNLFKNIFAVIGGLGALVGLVLAVKELVSR